MNDLYKVSKAFFGGDDLVAGSHRSSFDELTQWATWADKVLVF